MQLRLQNALQISLPRLCSRVQICILFLLYVSRAADTNLIYIIDKSQSTRSAWFASLEFKLLHRERKHYYENRKALFFPGNHSSILFCYSVFCLISFGLSAAGWPLAQESRLAGSNSTKSWKAVRKQEFYRGSCRVGQCIKKNSSATRESVTQSKLTGPDLKKRH